MNKYDMGSETRVASAVCVAIYVWVSNLLAVLLQPTMRVNRRQYLQILWCYGSKPTHAHARRGFQHLE